MSNNYEKMAKLAVEKSLLKEYATSDCRRTVYMKDGDEFQIQLFNPTSDTIGATIELNGNEIGGMLVLKPGERVWLERYIDDAVKFRYETYEVEAGDSDVKKAIQNNGDVKVKFFKEDVKKIRNKFPHLNWPNNDNSIRYRRSSTPYYGDMISTSSCNDVLGNLSKLSMASYGCSADNISASIDNNLYCCDAELSLDDDCTLSRTSMDFAPTPEPAMMETGRVGKGGYSDQNFSTVYLDFVSYPFYTADFKILPMSRKPVTSSDLQKIYCTECGRKLNTKFKFCPYCGAPTAD